MYLFMYRSMYLISPPIEGSLPPPFASLGTETGMTRLGPLQHPGALDFGLLAAADSALEAFPRPAHQPEEACASMEK